MKTFTINNLGEFISLIVHPKESRIKGYKEEIDENYPVIQEYYKILNMNKEDGFSIEKNLPFFLRNGSVIFDLLWYLEYKRFSATDSMKFYYRGNSSIYYKLAPGVYRANIREENYYFREMQVRCSMQLTQKSLLDKLVFLQHYGCPTRLLDITTNPLVALYFACGENGTNDGVVHCFAVNEQDILYPNSDRAQMLSHLCEFPVVEQEQMLAIAMYTYTKKKFLKSNNGKYEDSIIEKLYHAIKRETAAFEREMKPFDLLRPAFVQVSKSNQRIVKQDGAFIISGLNVDENDCDKRISKYVFQQIIIPTGSKKQVLKELEQVGICEATLFPEIDKVAEYLKQN